MCQPTRASMAANVAGCACGCCDCGCGSSFRRFFSAEEKRECLETYREQLKKELAGVEERMSELKRK